MANETLFLWGGLFCLVLGLIIADPVIAGYGWGFISASLIMRLDD